MRELKRWNRSYYKLRSRLAIIRIDLKAKWPLGINKRLKMWKIGLLSDKYTAYDLKRNDYRLYTTDFQEIIARFINYPYSEVLNNKLIFERFYREHVKVPRSYAIIDNGLIYEYRLTNKGFTEPKTIIGPELEKLAEQYGKLVMKPIKGAMGAGVMIVSSAGAGRLAINNKVYDTSALEESLRSLKQYFISEYIEQASYSRNIFPGAMNSMRILTMIDPEENRPFIAAAVKRFGTHKSAPIDNNAIGGIAAAIDMDTGELSKAAQFTGKEVIWHSKHPDSGVAIEGVVIPNWAAIKEKIYSLLICFPMIKYVGWDIAEQDEGIVALEGNNHPQARLLQIHKPLLEDERVARFYRHHQIIK
jgi:hypothetical protein